MMCDRYNEYNQHREHHMANNHKPGFDQQQQEVKRSQYNAGRDINIKQLGIGAALLLVIGILIASVIFNIGPLSPIVRNVWQQISRPFPPAQADESLIIVADFRGENDDQYENDNPANFLYHVLTDRIERDGLNIRVERLYRVLDANTVHQVGETYNATLVLWGEYNRRAIIPALERIRLPTQRITDEEGKILRIADPEHLQFSDRNLSTLGSYITLVTLGADRYAAKDYAAARDYLTSAIAAMPADEDMTAQPDEAYFLRGNVYLQFQQNYRKAIHNYEAALELNSEDASVLTNLGVAMERLDEYTQATAYYEQALVRFRDLEHRQGEAYVLTNLGVAMERMGEYTQARIYNEQAIGLFRDLGDHHGKASALINRGSIAYRMGKYAQAVTYYKEALTLFQNMGDHQGEVYVLINLGNVAYHLGEYTQARAYYEQARATTDNLGNRQSKAYALNGLGVVANRLKEYPLARTYHEQALDLFQDLDNRQGEAYTLTHWAGVAVHQAEYVEAIEHYTQALTLFRELGDRQGEAYALNGLGSVSKNLDDYAQARTYYEQALDIRSNLEDAARIAETSFNSGMIHAAQGNLERAEKLIHKAFEFYA